MASPLRERPVRAARITRIRAASPGGVPAHSRFVQPKGHGVTLPYVDQFASGSHDTMSAPYGKPRVVCPASAIRGTSVATAGYGVNRTDTSPSSP